MNEESQNNGIDPELEARIVALVLGEASDFEREELNRLIEQRPELAAFQEQMQSVHGLLRHVGAGETVAQDEEWKLSAEKRDAVLAAISGEAKDQPAQQNFIKSANEKRSARRNLLWNVAKIAAVLLVAGFVGSMALPRAKRNVATSALRQWGLAMQNYHEAEIPDAMNGHMSFEDGSVAWYGELAEVEEEAAVAEATVAEFEPNNGSRSALSDIRDTLGAAVALPSPHYLQDDVQYFPAKPESKLRTATPRLSRAREAQKDTSTAEISGPQPQQPTDGPAPVADDDDKWLDRGFAPGNRTKDSRPTEQQAANGQLSFPMFAQSPSELSRSEAAEPRGGPGLNATSPTDREFYLKGRIEVPKMPDSTVHVTEGGTVLLGGIKRKSVRDEMRVPTPPAVPSPTLDSHPNSELFGDGSVQSVPQDGQIITDFSQRYVDGVLNATKAIDVGGEMLDADGRMAMGDQPEGESEESAGYAGRAVGSQGSEQGSGQGQSSQRGAKGFDKDVSDSLADGKESAYGRYGADGEKQGGGGFGGGRGGGGLGGGGGGGKFGYGLGTDQTRRSNGKELSAPRMPDDISGRSTTRATRESYEQDFESAVVANSTPSPTNKPLAAREDFKKKGEPAAAGEENAELANDSINMPSEDAIATHKGFAPNPSFSVQIPQPVTGTVVNPPRGELKAGQATQHGGWRYEDQVRSPGQGLSKEEGGSATVQLPTDSSPRVSRMVLPDADIETTYDVQKQAKHSLAELSTLNELYRGLEIAQDAPPVDYDSEIKKRQNGGRASELSDEQAPSRSRLNQRGTGGGRDKWFMYVPPTLENYSKSLKKSAPAKKPAAGLNEKTADKEAFSTFSLHVSDVSFKLAQSALAQGEWPEAAKIRIEEFVNAFDYGDPMPTESEKVACRVEQSIHPFVQQRNLLRVSMRTAAAGRASNTPLRLTFLLDNSGSMERIDRQQTVRRAFALLAQQLKPIDQVTLISFARQPRLLADKVSGAQSAQLVGLIDRLPSEGGTNIEAALQLAFEKAREHKVDGAQNRIILLTDGAVNLGNANPESLSRMITTMRDAGIAFDAAGISAEGLNDEILEALTRKGDGRYYLLDSLESVNDGFARQIAGALRPSAKNVKVQIEFNPRRVGNYKLLGFEKHRLKKEDFRNDKVDAAEMAAAEAGVAVYQFEAKPDGEGDVGSVSVRFRDLSTGRMIEHCWPIPYEANAPRCDQAAPSLRIATSAALFAAKLRGEPLGETVDLKTLSNLIAGLPERDRNTKRVRQLQLMIGQARQVSGK